MGGQIWLISRVTYQLFQSALILPEFPIQLLAAAVVNFSQPISSSAGLRLSFACALCPLLEPGEALLQACSSFGDFPIFHRHFGETVIRVQSQGEKIILDDIFLSMPTMNIGLGKLDGIDRLGLDCGHNWDEFRRRLFSWRDGGLPALAPPGPLIQGQVAVPTRRKRHLLWIRPNQNHPAEVTDERHL